MMMMTIEQLTALRAAIPEDDDLQAATTKREQAAYAEQRTDLDRRIRQARAAADELNACALVEPDPDWVDVLRVARDALTTEIAAIKSDRKAFARHHVLLLSVHVVDHGPELLKDSGYAVDTLPIGELMRAAGHTVVGADPVRNYQGEMPWPSGSHGLKDLDRTIKANAGRRARAQQQLNEALMSDEERATVDAERLRQRKVLDELRVKHDVTGRPRPRDAAGHFLDLESLSNDQRAVFEKVYAS